MHQQHVFKFKSWRRVLFLSAAFLLALSVGTGCKKETSSLGASALNPDDLLASGAIDTFRIHTFSEESFSVRTDDQIFGLVGAYNDPKMGIMDASLYTQLTIAGTMTLPANATILIDSLVLALEYGGYYGKLSPQTFEVYRLDDTLSLTTSYYRTSTKNHLGGNITDPAPSWSPTITPNPTKQVVIGNDTIPAQLRLRLDTLVARSLVDDLQAGNSAFTNSTNFQNYFKGLHIKVSNPSPAPSTGGIMYFKMGGTGRTKMTIYYHISGDPLARTLDFPINANTADFNSVSITNIPAVQNVIDNPATNNQEQFYAQALKSYGGVQFAGIDNLPANCVIHDAVLVLPVAYQTGTLYYPSSNVLLGYKSASTGKILTTGETTTYDAATASYIVDVKDYVQSVTIGNAVNTGLYFFPLYMGGTAERIVFNGPNTLNKKKPRLIIKYTEY